MKREVILAIETGIEGGSLSLLENDFEIDFWKGEEKVSRSEDLLLNISNLLSKNKLSKDEIKKIAVAKGPGSFTGVRIGIATAKGLQKALRCELSGVSVLEAMTLKSEKKGLTIAAYALGKNDVCRQIFKIDDSGSIQIQSAPETISVPDFGSFFENSSDIEFILGNGLLGKMKNLRDEISAENIIEFDENFAKYVGLRSAPVSPSEEILPIYAR